MANKSDIFDLLAIFAAGAIVIAGLYYAYVVYRFNETTLLVSVILPVVSGSLILATRKRRVLVFAFLAYFWAVVDDAPVFFDSVLTWPQVTRFHPFLPRLYVNIVIHALTLLFIYLVLREPMKRSVAAQWKSFKVGILGLVAFGLAYAQNIPLAVIQNFEATSWYQLDVAEKLLSIAVLLIAYREARK